MERQYIDSGIEWIGRIPREWKACRFKYTGSFEKGKLPEEQNIEQKGLPIIGASEMLGKEPRVFTLDNVVPVCRKEDILILWDGANAGIVANGCEGVVSSTAVKFDCKDSQCNKQFIFYLLKYYENYFRSKVGGTTIPHMNQQYINDCICLLPSISEQQQIADYLDVKCGEIDGLIVLQEQMIAQLMDYKKSVITEAVTKGLNPDAQFVSSDIDWIGDIPEHWEMQRLKTLGWTQNGISQSGDYFGEDYEYPFVSYSDAYKNYSVPYPEGRANSSDKDRKTYSLLEGDVLFTRTSETIEEIGFSSTCLETIKDAVFSGFLIRFRPTSNKLYKGFSKYYFRSQVHRAYFVKQMNIVTRASLGQDLLKNLVVLLPPLAEQRAIADYLDAKCCEIDRLIETKRKKIETLKEYKKSVIYEAVTGKIDLRDN